MTDALTLYGYKYSVYNRAVRMVLEEKGLSYECVDVDPFAENVPTWYLDKQPFCRVPVLAHNSFEIYETTAIARYLDAAFPEPQLTPSDPQAAARMTQVTSIIDNYVYWPLVRQVFVQRVISPSEGGIPDQKELTEGLRASHKALDALEVIASLSQILNGKEMTLADCFLAPMVDYFVRAPEGKDVLAKYSALTVWWEAVRKRTSFLATDPDWQILSN